MTERRRFAVIPTHDRPREFIECLATVADQVDHVIVIDHRSTYASEAAARYASSYTLLPWDEELPNLSAMWNLGLDEAEVCAAEQPFDVAVLNDDVLLPFGWFGFVSEIMQMRGAAAGCTVPEYVASTYVIQHHPQATALRMVGHAFILDGDRCLRADERLRWWFGDNDLDWQARVAGGTLILPGMLVPNRCANTTTNGRLAEQANLDRKVFEKKWGRSPW